MRGFCFRGLILPRRDAEGRVSLPPWETIRWATLAKLLEGPNVRSGPAISLPLLSHLLPSLQSAASLPGAAPWEQEQRLHQLTGLAHLCATWHPISGGDLVPGTARMHGDMQGGSRRVLALRRACCQWIFSITKNGKIPVCTTLDGWVSLSWKNRRLA